MKTSRLSLAVFLIFTVASWTAVWAYEGPPPSVAEKTKSCDLYAKVHVLNVKSEKVKGPKKTELSVATVKVLKVWKGAPSSDLEIYFMADGLTCPTRPNFKSGEEYLIWARYDEAKKRFVIFSGNCAKKVGN